ncbi:MAG: putative phosphatase [Bacteroidetes bacterium HLUCCA01]|nr:MAG: putative phosphatase [Bacteroidetes bacterium HLUCCA01]
MQDKLILFDIDGTLLSVDHLRMRTLIHGLLERLELIDVEHHRIPFAGRTDRAIFSDLMGSAAANPARFEEVRQAYLAELNEHLHPSWVEVHDGVEETIQWCNEQHIPYGLLTGNFEQAAFIKLRLAGLDAHFRFGAFGCDHTDRNALPAIAHKKAEFSYNRTFTQKDIIIIGDTPNDVLCAQHYQARSVAVTTGPYSADQLRESNPDYVITSMQNPHNWLNELLQS